MRRGFSAITARSACSLTNIAARPNVPGWCSGSTMAALASVWVFASRPPTAPRRLAYLTWREGTSVYRETDVALQLVDGREVAALAYVVNRTHAHYAGRLPLPELLGHAQRAHGNKGSCRDYVVSTHRHLVSLGVHDAHLAWLAERLGEPGEHGSFPSQHGARPRDRDPLSAASFDGPRGALLAPDE